MGQHCFARWCLLSVVVCRLSASSSVTLPAGGPAAGRVSGQAAGRHCKAGQYGYVPLGRHLVHHVYMIDTDFRAGHNQITQV